MYCILPTVIIEVTNFRKVHYSSIPMPSPWLDPMSPISELFLHKHVFDIYVCAKAQHEALTVVHQENAGYIAVLLPRICLSAS